MPDPAGGQPLPAASRCATRRAERRVPAPDSPAPTTLSHHTARTVSWAATFGAACRDCPLRAQCTTARDGAPCKISEHDQLLRAARRHAEADEFRRPYQQQRPMVERSTAWLVRGGNRKVRYRGIAKNDQESPRCEVHLVRGRVSRVIEGTWTKPFHRAGGSGDHMTATSSSTHSELLGPPSRQHGAGRHAAPGPSG
jgi:hypothetical protein